MILIMRFSLPITTTRRCPLLNTSPSGRESFFTIYAWGKRDGDFVEWGARDALAGCPGILLRIEIGIPALNRALCSLFSCRG